MFERATVFSAVLFFIMFAFVGLKYHQYVEARNKPTPTLSKSVNQ